MLPRLCCHFRGMFRIRVLRNVREARRGLGMHALLNSVSCTSDACLRIAGGSLNKMSPSHSTLFFVRFRFIVHRIHILEGAQHTFCGHITAHSEAQDQVVPA